MEIKTSLLAFGLHDSNVQSSLVLTVDKEEIHPWAGALAKSVKITIEHHTVGGVSDDPTIGACWDADRLDHPALASPPAPA